MISTIFIKKLFYFFTTGTLLFYIVSFENSGQADNDEHNYNQLLQCQMAVKKMNKGRPYTLKEKYQVDYRNVLRLTIAEQKAINLYLKEMKTSLIYQGKSNPLRVSAYKFESRSSQVLGYKVVVKSWENTTEEATYFTDKSGNILFSYVDTLIPTKRWDCENEEI